MVGFLRDIGAELVIGDIRDKVKMQRAARGCDFIAHCAAQPAMTIALEQPYLDAAVNVIGTLNVLELAREFDVPMANCSTIHVYGNGLNYLIAEGKKRYYRRGMGYDYSITEEAPVLIGTLTPLHASKFDAECYVRAYAESYGVRAATFRLTGMYGPRQFGGEDHGWVANFAIRTILGLPITVYQTDKQVRDIIYVTDAVDAFDKFFKAGAPPGVYNICGGDKTAISLSEVLKYLSQITGLKQDIQVAPARQGDLLWFVGSYAKANANFGWEPRVDVVTGLGRLVAWIKENIGLFKGR